MTPEPFVPEQKGESKRESVLCFLYLWFVLQSPFKTNWGLELAASTHGVVVGMKTEGAQMKGRNEKQVCYSTLCFKAVSVQKNSLIRYWRCDIILLG